MLGGLKSKVALATAAGALTLAGGAIASSPAFAAQYNMTYYNGGGAVPVGTTFSGSSSSIAFVNSTGSSTYLLCTSSTLSGKTDAIVMGGPSAGLSVTGGSFGGCRETGQNITLKGNFSTAWQLTPLSQTTSPFWGDVTNISLTLTCGSASATYTGTLNPPTATSSAEEKNVTGTAGSGSQIVLTEAGSLTKSGTGCAAVPGTVYVLGTYTLNSVGGSTVSSTNNLWENYS